MMHSNELIKCEIIRITFRSPLRLPDQFAGGRSSCKDRTCNLYITAVIALRHESMARFLDALTQCVKARILEGRLSTAGGLMLSIPVL